MKNKSAILAIVAILVFCMSFSIVAYGGDTPIIPIPGSNTSGDSSESGTGGGEPDQGGSTVSQKGTTGDSSSSSSWVTPPIPVDDIIPVKKCTISGITNKVYTGKAIKPAPTVKYNSVTLKNGTDYSVSYKNNKVIGTATVTITGKGKYNGSVSKTFNIVPKATTLKKLTTPKAKQLKVTWNKQAVQTTGYQIQYSTNKAFKSGNKTVLVSGAKKTAYTIKGLKSKKMYYVRIRTYKVVGKTKYYSSWSSAKSIKVK